MMCPAVTEEDRWQVLRDTQHMPTCCGTGRMHKLEIGRIAPSEVREQIKHAIGRHEPRGILTSQLTAIPLHPTVRPARAAGKARGRPLNSDARVECTGPSRVQLKACLKSKSIHESF